MKKFIALILALIFAAAAFAGCTGGADDVTTAHNETTEKKENTTMTEAVTETPETSETLTAPDEDGELSLKYVYSFVKTDPEKTVTDGFDSFTVYAAKNETENAQLVISSSAKKTGLYVEAGPLRSANGSEIETEILREYYIKCLDTYYPDPVAPMNDTTRKFDVAAGGSQAIFIKLKTEKETPAGDYSGIVSVMQDGKTVKQARLFCHVWDFELPDTFTSVSVAGLGRGDINRFHDPNSGKDYYKDYYDFMLEYGCNAYDLPYDILDERADAYMSDPRVTSFRLPEADNETLVKYWHKLSTNEEWMKKAYFYPYDEPGTVDALNNMAGRCIRLHEYCPGVRIVVPFFQNCQYDDARDEIAMMSEYIDIWCPKTFCFTKTSDNSPKGKIKRILYSSKQRKTYPEFGERMQAEVAGGDDLWWYVCWEPGYPYLNMYVDMPGIHNKLLFWQEKQYNVSGFLYWSCSFWEYVENPWTNIATVGTDYRTGKKWLSDEVFGDGTYLYPGSVVGVDGPCGSFRLEMIRDGLEEYEMLTMLEAAAGREAIDAIIGTVSTSVVEYTSDNKALADARLTLGEQLEAALKK